MILIYVIAALLLIALGAAIVSTTRDLVRLLIGLEVMFIGALISLVPLYTVCPLHACMIVLALVTAAVCETILFIAVVFRLVRLGYRASVTFTEKYAKR